MKSRSLSQNKNPPCANEWEALIDSEMVVVAPRAIEAEPALAAIRNTYTPVAEQSGSETDIWPGASIPESIPGRTETATTAMRAAPTPRASTVPAAPAAADMAIARMLVAAPTPAPIQIIDAAREWILGRAKAAARPVKLLVGQMQRTLTKLREELKTADSPQDRHYLEGERYKRHSLVQRLTDMMESRLAVPEFTPHDKNERIAVLHEMLDPEFPRKYVPDHIPRPAMPVRSRRSAEFVVEALSDEFDRVQIEVHGAKRDGSPRRAPTADEAPREFYGWPNRHYADSWGKETLPKLLEPIIDEILPLEGTERRAHQAKIQAREEVVRLRAQLVLPNDTAATAAHDPVRARQHAKRYLQGDAEKRPSLQKVANDIAHERLMSTTAPPSGAIARESAIFEQLRPRTPDGAPIADDERLEHGNLAPVRTNAAARAVAARLRWWIDTVQARTYGTLPGTSEPKPAPATDRPYDKATRAKALSNWCSYNRVVMKGATKTVLEAEVPGTERVQSAEIAPACEQAAPRRAEPEFRTPAPQPAPTVRPALMPETPESAVAAPVTTAPGAPVATRESPEWETAFRRYSQQRLRSLTFTAHTAKLREARIRGSIRTPEAIANEPSSLLSDKAADAAAAILARHLDAFQVEFVGRTADGEPKSPEILSILDGDQNDINDIVSLWRAHYEDDALREAREAAARVERETPTKTPALARAPSMGEWRGPGR